MGVFLFTLCYSTLTNSYKSLILKTRGKGEAQADTQEGNKTMAAYKQYQRGTLTDKAKRTAELEHTLETMIAEGEATKRQIGAARGNVTRARQGLQEAIAAQLHKDEPYAGTNVNDEFEFYRQQRIRAYSLIDEEIEKYRKS